LSELLHCTVSVQPVMIAFHPTSLNIANGVTINSDRCAIGITLVGGLSLGASLSTLLRFSLSTWYICSLHVDADLLAREPRRLHDDGGGGGGGNPGGGIAFSSTSSCCCC